MHFVNETALNIIYRYALTMGVGDRWDWGRSKLNSFLEDTGRTVLYSVVCGFKNWRVRRGGDMFL